MKFDYSKISQNLIKGLPQRQKEVILRRFALSPDLKERETLEAIGKNFGITRERVRQIEADGLRMIKEKKGDYPELFQYFNQEIKNRGGVRKEDVLLTELGGEKKQNQVFFLLNLDDNVQRLNQTEDFYSIWFAGQNFFNKAKETISTVYQRLDKLGRPVQLKEIVSFISLDKPTAESYLEISKKIQRNSEGLIGLKDWPEINPRGIKDKAYLVFKKTGKPLHFSEIANLIKGSHLQTVHNELIRDERFVLVGRGTYALKEWGYYPGQVKDVIAKILKDSPRPLKKEEVLDRVLKQRIVKDNTVFLNLNNKEYFLRDSAGKYTVKEA